ncbi:SEC-C domain-containing protein [Brevibacillus ruminantium]|uniref:SEC-C domain-containing protein n=1 Tax=Brevibacillus ruminantium TaxID=2950604 RepID=A0ABY4WKA0_9BACL|nr:SEC-C metal-binding domain-containing protein [Brevibacillus ruminantium]USG67284.1 SEC-C domain-containing protein [Brevibacillus ruminantium]
MSVGRNELCPCGSGKKYKKCCGVVTPITELRSRHEQKLQKEYVSWIERLNHFVSGQISSETVEELRERFAQEVGLTEDEVKNPEWTAHFFNWLVLDVKTGSDTPLESYLKQHGRRMEQDLRRAFSRLHLNVYEIVQVERDVLTVQHPVSSEIRYVIRTNNLQVQPGQMIVGRLLTLGLRDQLFTGSIILQPHVKDAITQWLQAHPQFAEAPEDSSKRNYTTDLYRFIVQFGKADTPRRVDSLLRRVYHVPDMARLRRSIESNRMLELKKREGTREVWVYAPRKEEHLFPTLKDALLELYEVQAEVLVLENTVWVEGYEPEQEEVAELLQLPGEAQEEAISVLSSTGAKLTKGTLFITSQPTLPPKVLQWAVQTYFTEKWLLTPNEQLDELAPILVAASDHAGLLEKLRSLLEQLEQDSKLGQGVARFIRVEVLKSRLAVAKTDMYVTNLLSRPLIEGLPESVYTVQPELLAEINRFVQEVTEGKSEVTVKKYDEVMNNFRSFVRSAFGPGFTWEQLRAEDVAYFLVHDIYTRVDASTKTLATNLLSVLTAFFKWLDKQQGTSLTSRIQPLLAELKDTLPEAYRCRTLLEKEAHQCLFSGDQPLQSVAELTLVLDEQTAQGWYVKNGKGEKFLLKLPQGEASLLAPDWLISALLAQASDGTWSLLGTPELYPPVIGQFMGLAQRMPV